MQSVQTTFELKRFALDGIIPETEPVIKYLASIDDIFSKELSNIEPAKLHRILNTPIGIEIEVEGAREPEGIDRNYWNIVQDNSLRNGGLELVSKLGKRAYSAYTHIVKACKHANDHNWETSDRTSVHVHLGMTNQSLAEVSAMLILYTTVEKALFEYAGGFRYDNIFCVPLSGQSPDYRNASIVDFISHSSKYSALNTLALREKGTMEFRHMQTTFDPIYILRWITMLCLLRDYARFHSLAEIRETIIELKNKSDYRRYMSDIFGPFARHLEIHPDIMNNLVSEAKMYFFEEFM